MTKLSDLRPDASNANKGTERGRYALEASLRKFGAGRSILLDKHGHIVAGNKTAEVAGDVGINDVIIVQTDGTQLVAVQRTDLDIDSPEGRGLAYADNRVGQLSLEWDAEQMLADISAGVDLSGLWFPHELDAILNGMVEGEVDPAAEWQGMPEFEQEDDGAWKSVKINFASEDDFVAFSELIQQKLTTDTKSVWYPKKDKEKLKGLAWANES